MIVTLAEILTFLESTSASAAQIASASQLHPMVEAAVKDWLGYDPEQGTRTEYLAGAGGRHSTMRGVDVVGGRVVTGGAYGRQRLQLKHLPVRSVTSVYEDPAAYAGQAAGAFPAVTLLVAGTDYFIDFDEPGICRSGFLIKPSGWCTAAGSIKVTYVAGYSVNELLGHPDAAINASDLRMGVLLGVKDAWNDKGTSQGQVQSESLGNTSYTYALPQGEVVLSGRAKQYLWRFMNKGRRAAG